MTSVERCLWNRFVSLAKRESSTHISQHSNEWWNTWMLIIIIIVIIIIIIIIIIILLLIVHKFAYVYDQMRITEI